MTEQVIPTWASTEEFETFLSSNEHGIIFKHSTRCPVSSFAQEQVEAFLTRRPEAVVFRVLVVENRATSRAITDTLEVRHASPQAILVQDGKPVWDRSHNEITTDALEEAWNSVANGTSVA